MTRISQAKIENARKAVLEALTSSEVALTDLRAHLGVQIARAVRTAEYRHSTENRTQMVCLALQRVEGAASRFVKRMGVDPTNPLAASQSIRVNSRLANSWKHGLGGQANNETVLSGLLVVHRADGFLTTEGYERVHVLGMAVADGKEGLFSSCDLFEACARDWAALMSPVLPEVFDWAVRIAPVSETAINLPSDVHATVPLDATIKFSFPPALVAQLTQEARTRSASA